MNEKFFNHYVEILNTTLHEALGKNIVFQAESRVDKEELQFLRDKVEELSSEKNNSSQNHDQLQSMIQALNSQVELLTKEKNELQNIINSNEGNIDTIRRQSLDKENQINSLNSLLSKKDEEIKELNKNINILQEKNFENEKNIIELNGKLETLNNEKKKEPIDEIKNEAIKSKNNSVNIFKQPFINSSPTKSIKKSKSIEKEINNMDDF